MRQCNECVLCVIADVRTDAAQICSRSTHVSRLSVAARGARDRCVAAWVRGASITLTSARSVDGEDVENKVYTLSNLKGERDNGSDELVRCACARCE